MHQPAPIIPVDYACPVCQYNLRGLPVTGPDGAPARCPECGAPVPPWHLIVGDGLTDAQRTAEYLRHHDVDCRRCHINLRGREDGRCPKCGRTFVVIAIPRTAVQRAIVSHPVQMALILAALLGPIALLFVFFILMSL